MDPKEELRRLLEIRGKKRLLNFIPTITPKYVPPVHLAPLLERMELSIHEPQRVLVSTPPRHGKTETFMHAAAWILQQRPDWTIAYGTYEAKLAQDKSKLARRYALAAGVRLAKGSKSVQMWRTTKGGGMIAAGVGGPFTGQGANVFIVDDPFKGRKEAESLTQRETVWDWFINTVYPRLEPGASIYVNMARWHEDDLIGRLAKYPDTQFEVVNLPALDGDPPKALWPERYTVEDLEGIHAQVGDYTWQSLYLGRPSNKLGAIFKREWFTNNTIDIFPDKPFALERFAGVRKTAWDYSWVALDSAWKTGVGASYSVFEVWGKKGNFFYLRDVIRVRKEYPDLLRLAVDIFVAAEANALVIENSAAGLAMIPTLKRETTIPVIAVDVHESKTTRAEVVAPLIQSGRCKFPRQATWLSSFIEEHCAFPHGYDDQVDATSIALQHATDKARGFGFTFDRPQYAGTGTFNGSLYERKW
jgi:predicted phage terminase large subunit-like protein